MFWKRNKNSLNYLHFIHYSSDKLEPSDTADAWSGKVRVLIDTVKEQKDFSQIQFNQLTQQVVSLKKENAELKDSIKNLSENINEIKDLLKQ